MSAKRTTVSEPLTYNANAPSANFLGIVFVCKHHIQHLFVSHSYFTWPCSHGRLSKLYQNVVSHIEESENKLLYL